MEKLYQKSKDNIRSKEIFFAVYRIADKTNGA